MTVANVVPGPAALELAEQIGKDARLVELILCEAQEVVRTRPNLIVVTSPDRRLNW